MHSAVRSDAVIQAHSMTACLRFADPATASRYPFAVGATLAFLPADDALTVTIPIPVTIPPGTILAASFVTPAGVTPPHAFTLHALEGTWPLLPVPSAAGERPDKVATSPAASSQIDCWHATAALHDVDVRLRIACSEPPANYLLVLSWRPLRLDTPPLPPEEPVLAPAPRRLSQMLLDQRLRHHACSPTSVAMLLASGTAEEIAADCLDAATGLFGSWAMAVRTAGARGCVAAVELQDDWARPLQLLRLGRPFAASIRFGAGELDGAPLNATSGHLVVVYGIEGDTVLAHDPAAPDLDSVPRRYPVAQFSRAWLLQRGASYIIAP